MERMNDVTFILISFLRPGWTEACIRSIRKMYPDTNILVGENGPIDFQLRDACQEMEAEYIRLPYDSGVCYARNRLVEMIKTEFICIGDDDFLYDKDAQTDRMAKFMRNADDYDLIGGRIFENGKVRNYQGYVKRYHDHFESFCIDFDTQEWEKENESGLLYCEVDLTFNYFVARTRSVSQVQWDEQIKVAYEHFSWFADFRAAKFKVAFSPEPIVIHKPNIKSRQQPEYASYRMRKEDQSRFFDRFGISYTIGMGGNRINKPIN